MGLYQSARVGAVAAGAGWGAAGLGAGFALRFGLGPRFGALDAPGAGQTCCPAVVSAAVSAPEPKYL